MLIFHNRHDMVVDKFLEVISLKQNKGLEKRNFNTQKRNQAEDDQKAFLQTTQ